MTEALRRAAEAALDILDSEWSLEGGGDFCRWCGAKRCDPQKCQLEQTLAALRAALAEPQQPDPDELTAAYMLGRQDGRQAASGAPQGVTIHERIARLEADPQRKAALDRARAALAAPQGEPVAWRMVPVEATPAMRAACRIARASCEPISSDGLWAVMLDAAPPAPVVTVTDEMVERACVAMYRWHVWDNDEQAEMRAALEAALAVRKEER